jgi:hypothetical protein
VSKIDDLISQIESIWESPGFRSRRVRMENDYGLYRMNPYDAGNGYQSYTSNAPKILADKIMSYLSNAQMSVRVPLSSEVDDRTPGTLKEKFVIGALNLADERMQRYGQPSVREQLAFYVTLRGWYAGRAMLNKHEDGSTYVDITPFDPLHICYEMDDQGIVWLAHKTKRSPAAVKRSFNVDVEPLIEGETSSGVTVWDYYSRTENAILISGSDDQKKFGKPLTKHNVRDINGNPCAPVFLGAVGPAPWIQDDVSGDDTARDYGESIFSANRTLYDDYNFAMSAYKTLVRRAVRRPYKIVSPDGTTTLDTDPWQDGSEVPLPAGTDIRLMDEITMPLDTGAFVGLVSGELQRGGLSNVSYGELPFAISGFAAKILQEGSAHQIEPRVKGLTSCYKQVSEIVSMQYETGGYDPVSVRGRHNDIASYFNQEIKPADLEGAGAIDIKLGVRMPQDEPQLITMAQMMREGTKPLAPDEWIWENVLQINDVDQFRNSISAQQAQVTEPKALLLTLIEGLMQTGEQEKALIYVDLLRKTLKQDQQKETAQDLQFQQLLSSIGMTPPQPGQGAAPSPQVPNPNPGSTGRSPMDVSGGIMSSQMQGFQRTGNPQQAPPGTPGGAGPRVNPLNPTGGI